MSWKRPNLKSRMQPLMEIIPENLTTYGIIIDIGAGEGFFTDLLKKKFQSNLVIAADIQRSNKISNFIILDLCQPPFRRSAFSGVFLSQTLHYVPKNNQFNVLNKLVACVDKSGWLFIIEYVVSQSYYWIPYPIMLGPLEEFKTKLVRKNSSNSKLIRDGNRPKISWMLYFEE